MRVRVVVGRDWATDVDAGGHDDGTGWRGTGNKERDVAVYTVGNDDGNVT